VVAQLRREASDEIWLVALQRDEARAELVDVHRHVADLDAQLAAARRQCEWLEDELRRTRAQLAEVSARETVWMRIAVAAVNSLDAQPDTETSHG
jgi:chromosome segregation ATPase